MDLPTEKIKNIMEEQQVGMHTAVRIYKKDVVVKHIAKANTVEDLKQILIYMINKGII